MKDSLVTFTYAGDEVYQGRACARLQRQAKFELDGLIAGEAVIQQTTSAETGRRAYQIQTPPLTPEKEQALQKALDDKFQIVQTADGPAYASQTVGPTFGSDVVSASWKAVLIALILILIYITFRFEWKFAVAAIIANLHDVVIILGFFAFFQWEFSLAVLAAVLAVLGYSVNESVVIFDRIRENFRRYRKMNTVQIIDNAITSTISRTIITHGCTQAMVLSMLLFGGPTLHYFALALTIGILFGIYSSVFVAAAIAMWLGIKREDLIKSSARKEEDPQDPNAGATV